MMTDAWSHAVYLLARREYGEQELMEALIRKGYARDIAREAVDKCMELDLQNDARYTESFFRMRIRQGYGPVRISQELREKRISQELIETVLNSESPDWLSHAQEVWKKKTKDNLDPLDFVSFQKIQRFLVYRGFPPSMAVQVAQIWRESMTSDN